PRQPPPPGRLRHRIFANTFRHHAPLGPPSWRAFCLCTGGLGKLRLSSGIRIVKWDIFCNAVANFGAMGVSWRLARHPVPEHGLAVRLWVDEPAVFTPLCPQADPEAESQYQQGVDIRHWRKDWPAVETADVVIEA